MTKTDVTSNNSTAIQHLFALHQRLSELGRDQDPSAEAARSLATLPFLRRVLVCREGTIIADSSPDEAPASCTEPMDRIRRGPAAGPLPPPVGCPPDCPRVTETHMLRVPIQKHGLEYGSLLLDCIDPSQVGLLLPALQATAALLDRLWELQELNSKHQRLSHIVNGTNLGTWEWNIQTGEAIFNRRWSELLGFSVQELAPVGVDTWQRLCHPEDLPLTQAKVQQCIRGEIEQYICEYRLRHRNGSWIWILDQGKIATRTPDGRAEWMFGSYIDITRRKQAERIISENERQLSALIESTPDIICFKDGAGRWLVANAADLELFSLTNVDYRGKTDAELADFTHPMYREAFLACEASDEIAWQAGELSRGEEVIPRPDGVVKTYDVLKVPIFEEDGTRRGLVVLGRDISEQKASEADRERLLSAIGQAAEIIMITDTEGTIEYVNPAFEEISGFSSQEALGQNPRILKSGEHDEDFYRDIWETITAGEVWSGRIINRKKSGALFTVESVISPVRDETGRTVNFVAVKRDITRELQLEEQFQQAQRMEAIGQLAGGVAHDFNNLLQVILGSGELALELTPEGSDTFEFLQDIIETSNQAKKLISQLLAFSRRQVLSMSDVDLNGTIGDMLNMLRRVIGEHVILDFQTGSGLGLVRADAVQIGQILTNLCVNSRDAMPQGGVVTITTRNAQLDEAFCSEHPWASPGDYVVLTVSDTGCGMDEETRTRIFEPFFTTKGIGEGTGLGLSTVYGLVKQHQGFLDVKSAPGEGASFSIYLPRTAGGSPKKLPRPTIAPTRGQETILLAEDEEMVRMLTRTILERAGYSVLAAKDGIEALELFERNAASIDLLLLDIMMPRCGGHEVFQKIRETHPDIRVIFATGYGMEIGEGGVLRDEGFLLVEKPVNREHLLRAIRSVLDGPASGSLRDPS